MRDRRDFLRWGLGSALNTVRLAVRAELVEAQSPFDSLRANELKRTALGRHWLASPSATYVPPPSREFAATCG